ncbi:spore germination protein [Metabacillus niabensis]|uniref:spore germination protein n=1 Tax=Metabacillus niabensis TaxID=324854 RepID=UPI001CF9A375|nr:spore germination protein [Metabacillus niabensis]
MVLKLTNLFKRNIPKKNEEKNKHLPFDSAKHNAPISVNLTKNINKLLDITGNAPDLIIRGLEPSYMAGVSMSVVYISGLANNDIIDNAIMNSILDKLELTTTESILLKKDVISFIKRKVIKTSNVEEVDYFDELLSKLFAGDTIIFIEGAHQALTVSTLGWEHRGVEEPQSQTVIRGPKEGFTEDLNTNTTLIRRKIKSPNLWMENMKIGKVTETKVVIMYLKGVVNEKVLEEVKQRLKRIETDSILESGYIEEFIQDSTFSPFPTISNSERPDTIAGGILEGQVAILIDGTPFVLMAPVTFFKFFQASEDYYHRYDIVTFIRIMRFSSFFVSMLLPSLYIAITTFHQEMLPTTMLVSLMAQREGIPFPAFVEALIMEITFEVLREAGVRMPRAIGPAISIVGALVLGQAAVQAGLVSAAMVIIVSFTAISNFVAPHFNMAIAARLLRFAFMLLAATLGLFGIMSGLLIVLIHLVGLRSFGVPYLMPLAPFMPSNQKDVFVRVPWWAMKNRPVLIGNPDDKTRSTTMKATVQNNESHEEYESQKE